MTNAEIETVLKEMARTMRFLGQEIADLVDDRANRNTKEHVASYQARANEIRQSVARLGEALGLDQ